MNRLHQVVIGVIAASLLLAACAPSAAFSPEMNTAVAYTVVAMRTQTAAAFPPTAAAPTPTVNPYATFTPISTFAPTIAPTATLAPALRISSWTDVTIPSGTNLMARQSFTKKWTLTNGGSSSWQKDYLIILVSGDNMGVTSVPLGVAVDPGSSVTISLNLVAPASLGAHAANFMLQTPSGVKFGFGDNANQPFSVRINVQEFFAVTSATPKVTVPSGATCPVEITLTAVISANASGEVTYRFVTSQGSSDTYSMTFSAKGTLTSSPIKFKVTSPADLTVNIYVDNPNHQNFSPITITAPCTP